MTSLPSSAVTGRRRQWLIADRWTWNGRARPLTMVARPALLLALVGLLVIALVLVTLLAGGRKPAPPFGLARPGWITIDTADGIQLARVDGTERHVLVPADGQSLSPTWSRDGLHVAFWHRAANPGPWQLVVVDADGGDRQVVADGVNLEERESIFNQPSSISWSPDSRRMAYAADVAGGSAIFVVDRDVYGPTRITDPALKAVDPAWSPDGTRIASPGNLPPGDYTTQAFYPGGLTVTLDDGWTSHEDSTGEFSLARIGSPDDNLDFWLDVTPTTWDGERVDGIPNEPWAIGTWLHDQAALTVTPAKQTTIGKAKLPALVMDITLAKDAPNGDPGCPTASCAALFWWPQWDEPYAMASDMHVRLYLAKIGSGPHVLFAMLNVVDADAFAPFAKPILDSVLLSDALG